MVFVVNAFFLSFCEKKKEAENEEKNISGLQKKAKVNVNIDCFSLIKGQWKLFKGQWNVREKLGNCNFLMSGNPERYCDLKLVGAKGEPYPASKVACKGFLHFLLFFISGEV